MAADASPALSVLNLRLPRSSRFRHTFFYPTLEGVYGRWAYNPDTFKNNDGAYHTVELGEEYRLDLIAFNSYGDTFLWWVIALTNEIINPFDKPEVGDVLYIPAYQTVFAVLSS